MAKANDKQAGATNSDKPAPSGWYFPQVAMQVVGGLTVAAVCALVGYAWAISSTVAVLQERLNTVPKAEEIVSLQERLIVLENEKISAKALDNSLANNANSVSAVAAKVEALQQNSLAHQTTINKHSLEITDLQHKVTSLCSESSKADAKIGVLASLPETIASLRERIAKLESVSGK